MVFAKLGDGGLFIGLSFWIGVAVLIYLAKRKSFRFKEGQITERWETLINQGSGNTDAVYEVIYHFLESVNPPKVKWERAGVRAGDLLTGRQYDGLKVTNSYLKDYMMYIFAYDYGTTFYDKTDKFSNCFFIFYRKYRQMKQFDIIISVLSL